MRKSHRESGGFDEELAMNLAHGIAPNLRRPLCVGVALGATPLKIVLPDLAAAARRARAGQGK